jgi:hypothetical protein
LYAGIILMLAWLGFGCAVLDYYLSIVDQIADFSSLLFFSCMKLF